MVTMETYIVSIKRIVSCETPFFMQIPLITAYITIGRIKIKNEINIIFCEYLVFILPYYTYTTACACVNVAEDGAPRK
jgi:hypothetical protein